MQRVHNVVTMIVSRAAGAPGKKRLSLSTGEGFIKSLHQKQVNTSPRHLHFQTSKHTIPHLIYRPACSLSLWHLKAANAAAVKCQLCNGNWSYFHFSLYTVRGAPVQPPRSHSCFLYGHFHWEVHHRPLLHIISLTVSHLRSGEVEDVNLCLL